MFIFLVHGAASHPCDVVEASSLAYSSPPPLTYHLMLLNEANQILTDGVLSDVQLEAGAYACQKHEEILPSKERAGFFFGI